MQITTFSAPGLVLIQPKVFRDSRGFFLESFNKQTFTAAGLGDWDFVQDNLSQSQKGTIRGLHFQKPPHAQGKLVTVFQGAVLDVAVDLRKGSPTFGKATSVILDAENPSFFMIPPGFAHGFQVLSDTCLFYYKCTDYYAPNADSGILWNDPSLQIPWVEMPFTLSPKDEKQPLLADIDSPFVFEG